MPTLVFHTGFEQGIIGASGQLFTEVTPTVGTIEVVAGSARNGSYGLRHLVGNDRGNYTKLLNTAASTMIVGRVAFRVNTPPPSGKTARLFEFGHAGVDAMCVFVVTSAMEFKARAGANPAATHQTAGTITEDAWHLLEFRFNVIADPYVLDWRLDGVEMTQATFTGPARAATACEIWCETYGDTSATDSNILGTDASFDDVAISLTSGDYPLGDGKGLACVPSAEATHATEASFEVTTNSFTGATELNTISDGHTYIDDVPWTTAATDYLRQSGSGTGVYAEFDLSDPAGLADGDVVNAVSLVSWMRGATATSCNARHTIDPGGTPPTATSFTLTTTTRVAGRTIYPLNTNGNVAWTGLAVKGTQARWGHSNDVSPNPWLDALMLEVDVFVSSVTQVSTTKQLVWNQQSVVNATRQLVWNNRAPVAATRQLVWNVIGPVGPTRQLVWNVSTPVSTTKQLVWNVAAFVGATRQLVWNVTAVIAATRQLVWSARAPVNATRQLVWNVIGPVGPTRSLVWNNSTSVNLTRQLVWNNSTSVNLTRQLIWGVRTVVGTSGPGVVLNETFTYSNGNLEGNGAWASPLATGDDGLDVISNQAYKSGGTTYVGSYLATSYGDGIYTLTLPVVPVGVGYFHICLSPGSINSYFLRFEYVFSGGDKTRFIFGRYDGDTPTNLLGATDVTVLNDGDRIRIVKNGTNFKPYYYRQSDGFWTQLGSAGGYTDANYSSGYVGIETNTTTGRFDNLVIESLTGGYGHSLVWNVLPPPPNFSKTLLWNQQATVGASRQLVWAVSALVSVSRVLVWSNRATIAAERALVWSVRSVVGATRQLVWNVTAPVAATRQLVWNVTTSTGATRQLVWHVLKVVAAEVQSELIDDFNRANGALGAPWAGASGWPGYTLGEVVSNTLGHPTVRYHAYVSADYGDAQQIEADIAAIDGVAWAWFDLHLTSPGSSPTAVGIQLARDGTGYWLEIWDDWNGAVDAASGYFTPAVGDSLRARITADGWISAWHKPAGGSWTLLVQFKRVATPLTGRKIGLGTSSNGIRFDNVRGGDYVPTARLRWNQEARLSVGNDYTLIWNQRAAVPVTRQLIWNVRALASATRQLIWNASTFVSATRQLIWHQQTLASATRSLVWNVAVTAGATRQLIWHVRALAGVTRQLVWNQIGTAALDRTLIWNVSGGAVNVDRTLRWNVSTFVGQTRILHWRVSTLVGASRDLLWTQRALASVSRIVVWNVQALAAATSRLIWNVRALAPATRTLLWNASTFVDATRSLLWTQALLASAPQRTLRWDQRALAGFTRILHWRVRAVVPGTDRTLLWTQQDSAGVERTLLWTQIGYVFAQRTLRWDQRALATVTKSLPWAQLLLAPAPDQTLLWHSLATATTPQFTLRWNVQGLAGVERVLHWRVSTTVPGTDRTLLWNVRAAVGQSRTLRWDVRLLSALQATLRWRTEVLIIVSDPFYPSTPEEAHVYGDLDGGLSGSPSGDSLSGLVSVEGLYGVPEEV